MGEQEKRKMLVNENTSTAGENTTPPEENCNDSISAATLGIEEDDDGEYVGDGAEEYIEQGSGEHVGDGADEHVDDGAEEYIEGVQQRSILRMGKMNIFEI